MIPFITLKARSLFDKYGFGDGDMLADLLLDNDIDPDLGEGEWDSDRYTLEDRLLMALVEKYLLPLIPEKLEPRFWRSCHNPVRCDGWAGSVGDHIPQSCKFVVVEVPEADVLALAREIEQTIKAELAQDGAQ